MHLKQLKLSGFKSFVDPTIVYFPGQLVAVLGPNGCGKSNIIDAVRWVMGESSAKNLRGESMADVIFNGSSTRKPLGQASVELIFDNSMGRLTGPFASYGEIVVKRLVTRDGDSSYFLNGARCRRKDITDIFLGTGAGARGYSIIGQGTISRLIEARPEELRAYLEEAAGVSKYKERRRETLQRIEHTRENLTRVADIREELDKQLQRLERQAKAAERYVVLKEEERRCRADILALKWNEFNTQQEAKQKALYELALIHEQQNTAFIHATTERTVLSEQLQDMNDVCQQIQANFYQIGTEIARLEESIQQQEREKRRLEQDRQLMQTDWQRAEAQLKRDKEELTLSQSNASNLSTKLQELKKTLHEYDMLLQKAQAEQAQWDLRWQEVQSSLNHSQKEMQISAINLTHIEQKRQQTLTRYEKLSLERTSFSIDDLVKSRRELEEKQLKLNETHEFDAEQLRQSNETVAQLRTQTKDSEAYLNQLQDHFLKINTELAAMAAAQKAAAHGNQSNNEAHDNWADKPRLMNVLKAEPEWQSAIEMVLGESLNAYVLEEFDWNTCNHHRISAVTIKSSIASMGSKARLSDKIQDGIPLTAHSFDSIYTASTLDEAINWLPSLADYESLILANGTWIGRGWIKFSTAMEDDEIGLLARQQKINELTHEVHELKQTIETARLLRDENRTRLEENNRYQELFQLNLNGSADALRVNQNAITGNEQAILQSQKFLETLQVDSDELQQLLEELTVEQLKCVEQHGLLQQQCQTSELAQVKYSQEKEQWQTTLNSRKQQTDEARLAWHQSELEYDRELNKTKQLTEQIQREEERLQIAQERLERLAEQCMKSVDPALELQKHLELQLQKHTEIETMLTEQREHVAQTRIQLDDVEKTINMQDAAVKKAQDAINQTRMEEQALGVRASSVQEALDEQGIQAKALLQEIPAGVTQNLREEELLEFSEKIKRLGAINLAAIEEYTAENERKLYLDEQYNDLNQALSALETAIEKMDNETRLRLENTFAEVNTSFKSLFPRLFGGGRAELQLTCDNLLEAGIVVMAQPPGKRNSTIHLLSGGEKAMTAVALVFAIFQLNPSPFCMLDEVDAPLDDVNVGRFCGLVKEMSQFVQFLFITHNKVTMELADHLIGVTMREPGVSRLVTVDVEHALTLE